MYDQTHDSSAFDTREATEDRCECWGCAADDVRRSSQEILDALEQQKPDGSFVPMLANLHEDVCRFTVAARLCEHLLISGIDL